jgi:hypothetical protein
MLCDAQRSANAREEEHHADQEFGRITGDDWDEGIDDFLRKLVRRILKQALREPQLFTDLKG